MCKKTSASALMRLYKGDSWCEFKSPGFPCQIAVTKT